MTKRIAIIGAGSWGTALAIIGARAGHEVAIWSRDPEVVSSINEQRVNSRYLTSASIPDRVTATKDITATLDEASLVLLAAPSHAARELLTQMSPALDESAIIVSVSKGIEIETGKRISEIAKESVGGEHAFVCLSGPSFAKEVVIGQPTAVVAASKDATAARTVQADLSFENLRIYTNADVVGTELGGSVKNVMAIAAGMTTGSECETGWCVFSNLSCAGWCGDGIDRVEPDLSWRVSECVCRLSDRRRVLAPGIHD